MPRKLLNTLLLSSVENIVMVDKTTFTHIQNCVKESQYTLEFLQLESQLLQEETHFELIHVQNSPLYDSFQQPAQNDATS